MEKSVKNKIFHTQVCAYAQTCYVLENRQKWRIRSWKRMQKYMLLDTEEW